MRIFPHRVTFDFTEYSQEKELARKGSPDAFETDNSCSPYDSAIRPMVNVALHLCNVLDLDYESEPAVPLSIIRDSEKIRISWLGPIVDILYRNGTFYIQSLNGYAFSQDQFNTMFFLVNTIVKYKWF